MCDFIVQTGPPALPAPAPPERVEGRPGPLNAAS